VTKLAPTFTILGRVSTGSGVGVPGVAISAGDGRTATTASDGAYTLSQLLAGSYTITPISPLYRFSPPSRTSSVPPAAVGQDFTAVVSPVYVALVRVAPPPPPPPACKDDIEPNDRPDQARPLTLIGQACSGSFQDDAQGQDDYYSVQLNAGQKIGIDLTRIAAGADYDLVLYDTAQTQLAVSKFPGQDDEHIPPTAVGKTGRYYLRVFMRTKSAIAPNNYVLQVMIS
jgi:hypothetical protein